MTPKPLLSACQVARPLLVFDDHSRSAAYSRKELAQHLCINFRINHLFSHGLYLLSLRPSRSALHLAQYPRLAVIRNWAEPAMTLMTHCISSPVFWSTHIGLSAFDSHPDESNPISSSYQTTPIPLFKQYIAPLLDHSIFYCSPRDLGSLVDSHGTINRSQSPRVFA